MEVIAASLAAVVVVGGWIVISYNRFVAQVASIDASWAGIDVELQRRHDIVGNLVEVVRGYATHERTVLETVASARSRAVESRPETVATPDQARAEDALTDGLTRLLALTEQLPQLRSHAPFQRLQRQLIETEDRIVGARRLYNIQVAAYRRRRRAFPSNLVAEAFGFGPRDLFEIRDAAAIHAAATAF